MIKKISYFILVSIVSFFFAVSSNNGYHYFYFNNIDGKLIGNLFFILSFIPLATYLYAKIFISNQKNKIKVRLLLSTLCPIVMVLPFSLVSIIRVGFGVYLLMPTLKLFAWCELWSLLGLVNFKFKKGDSGSIYGNNSAVDDIATGEINAKTEMFLKLESFRNKTQSTYWLLMPVAHCVLLILGYLIFYVWVNSISDNDGWGGVVWAFLFFVAYAFNVSPIMSIIYCKKISTMDGKKYLCAIYNAVIMGLYYIIIVLIMANYRIELKHIIQALISVQLLSVFISALLCGIITLICCDVKRKFTSTKSECQESDIPKASDAE